MLYTSIEINEHFWHKWRHLSCDMTSSIIPSLSILNIWWCGGLTALKLSSVRKRNVNPSNDSGYPDVWEKLSFVRPARDIRSKKIVTRSNASSYPFKTIVSRATVPNHSLLLPEPFATNLSKTVSSNNSSKPCLPLSHEFSHGTFSAE